MIFVTVGTNEAPFDRLVEATGRFGVAAEQVVVQYGASSIRPLGATLVDFVPFDRLVDYVRAARVVVTHAGVGSVLVALSNGHRPIVMPRLRRYGEAVDDHQAAFAAQFAETGLVTLVRDASELEAALDGGTGRGVAAAPDGGLLVDELRSYLTACISRR